MTEPSVSFAGNLTDDPELRHTEAGIARARFQVAVSGRQEQEARRAHPPTALSTQAISRWRIRSGAAALRPRWR
jgi:single-stranded DNA-binding protein